MLMLRATLTTLSILLVNGCSTHTFTQDEHTSIDDNVYAGEVLRKQATPVSPKDKDAQELVNLLMSKASTGTNAVGLAAPQLGINKAAFVYRVPKIVDGKPQFPETWEVALNPSYTPISKETTPMAEGCFSVPHFYSKAVPRYKEINFRYQNINGQWQEDIVDGYKAQILQHETDHLSGILYIDKIENKGDLSTIKDLTDSLDKPQD
ncbi:peptide deformylase [Vibrio pectenicida]|uniref:Peptide deformylase n=1 Tax=Vibrio pectenicida TaxID=62763 RepID=A0A7Y4EG34_9VIBR|nr:peptide deformylase [Vibrio pectenicida]NOH73237.1 peptide deformylase [Vibrio pectenicida]